MSVDFKKIEKLLQLAKQYKLAEFEIEENRFKLRVKFKSAAGMTSVSAPSVVEQVRPAPAAAPAVPAMPEPTARATKPSGDESRYHKVLSPFVGTFYRAPSPEAEPYVKEGQTIRKGDILCIVEAMKLMNEIEGEVAGKVVSILAENGQAVEYGEPLFLVDPL